MNTIEKLDELHSKATSGPWREYKNGLYSQVLAADAPVTKCVESHAPCWAEDAQLIIALHNAWPAISAVLRQAERVRIDMTYEELLPLADALTALDKCMKDEAEK